MLSCFSQQGKTLIRGKIQTRICIALGFGIASSKLESNKQKLHVIDKSKSNSLPSSFFTKVEEISLVKLKGTEYYSPHVTTYCLRRKSKAAHTKSELAKQ